MGLSTYKLIVKMLIAGFLLSGCFTAKHYYKTGNYEQAVATAAKKLRKNSKRSRQLEIIEKAYKASIGKDLDRIQYLKLEGSPDSWMEIYDLYTRIDRVASYVRPLLPLYFEKELRYLDIELVDIKQEMAQAKSKAAEYLYTEGEKLLASNNINDIRASYYRFLEVEKLYPSFKDVNRKIDEAYEKGQEYVLISVVNNSHHILPKAAFEQIDQMPVSPYNSQWVKYKTADDGSNFSKQISVIINDVSIGAEQIREKNFHYEKDIEDGWKYQLDDKGNVVKDTAGNDVKIPVIRRISADVRETTLYKDGGIAGSFKLNDNHNNSVIANQPFSEVMGFNHVFATLTGDKRAVPKEMLPKIVGKPVHFPPDDRMLIDAFFIIKDKLAYFIDQQINRQINYSVNRNLR